MRLLLYALSAATLPGLRRSWPMRRGTRILSNTDSNVDLTIHVGGGLDLLEQVLPGTVRRPQSMALVHGLPRAEPLGKIAPVRIRWRIPSITCR
jgi:hypothetical protein